MSERFSYIAFDGFMDDGEFISPHQVVKLLNELNKENELLKKEELVEESLELFKQNMLLKQDNEELRERINDYNVALKTLQELTEKKLKENEQLKKENQGIQDKVMRLLDYVELKQCVTRTEIKKWWNGDLE